MYDKYVVLTIIIYFVSTGESLASFVLFELILISGSKTR